MNEIKTIVFRLLPKMYIAISKKSPIENIIVCNTTK